jgi:isopenicillin N synthase-like dioxygenase
MSVRDPAASGASEIPVIDLSGLRERRPSDLTRIAREIRFAGTEVGFLYIAGHGVPQATVDACFAASARFMALPIEAKRKIAVNRFHRGYIGVKTSTIVTSTVARVTKPNVSESFMKMHDVSPHDPEFGQPLQGPNQWPEHLPGFREAVEAYDAALRGLANALLPAMALALHLPADWFAQAYRRPTTFLRLMHYPPQPQAPEDQFGSAPHTDYGVLTILVQDGVGGLEIKRKDGSWMPAPSIPGTFIVNIGDILARWTNDLFISTPHRVVSPSNRERYSIPFFFDPAMDTMIEPLATCCGPERPARYPPVRFGDYLLHRLDTNYSSRSRAAAS